MPTPIPQRWLTPAEKERACAEHGLTSADFRFDFVALADLPDAEAARVARRAARLHGPVPDASALWKLRDAVARARPEIVGAPTLWAAARPFPA